MKKLTRTRLLVITLGSLAVIAAGVVALPHAFPPIYFLFDDTTITFRNDSGRPCTVAATVTDVEHDGRKRVHRWELPVGGAETVGVLDGIKRIRYTIDGEQGEIDFDMWYGEDVVLAVSAEKTLTRVFDR